MNIATASGLDVAGEPTSWADLHQMSLDLGKALGWESKFTKRGWRMRRAGEAHWSSFLFFAARLEDCRVAEVEIERRGLVHEYMMNLSKGWYLGGSPGWFRLATADAETRCRAMLAAVRGAV